jgi:protein-S-isoprenylcysteine O-methyltransferase Ste14
MSKMLKTVAMLLVIYVAPLLGNAGLMLNARIALLMIAGIIMFMTQPELKVSEAREKKSTDRNSIFIILLAGALSQICAIIEWAYLRPHPQVVQNIGFFSLGIVMVVGGLVFRLWAIKTLARYFTSTVQIVSGHRVIQHGPYKVVRHPSYLGALITIVGSAVVLEAPVSALIALVAMAYAYTVRIGVEEIALVSELGEEYRKFQQVRRYKVIPLVW